jgi:hypothetical protein
MIYAARAFGVGVFLLFSLALLDGVRGIGHPVPFVKNKVSEVVGGW